MNKKRNYFLIILACFLFIAIVENSGYLDLMELKSIDMRFFFREDIFSPSDEFKEQSADITIIGIDDDSIIRIKEPFILWDTLFAKIIEKLAENGAKVIGLDAIWSKSIDDFVKRRTEDKNAFKKALLISKHKYHTDIIMGIGGMKRQRADSIVNNRNVDSATPLKRFSMILGKSNFGIINLTPDPDKFIRRQRLIFESIDDNSAQFFGFDLLIVRRYLEQDILPHEEKPLINYSTNIQFLYYPFYYVLKKAADDDRNFFIKNFKDKIVLIGITSLADDRFPTPISKETSGIIIHANSINTFLRSQHIKTFPENYKWILISFFCFTIGGISSFTRLSAGFTVTLLSMVMYLFIAIHLFVSNILIPLSAPLLSIPFTFGGIYIYRFVAEEKEKRRLTRFFKNYVDDHIVDGILASDSDIILSGKRKKICILFSDIRGFTTFSEKHPPEEVVSILNEYFMEMTEAILKNSGTLNKFIGDGIMAYFGDPVTQDNPALNAVKAALMMRDKLKSLNDKWQKTKHFQLDNGIGIHTGEAVIGNIGSPKKMDYTAIGDSVNLASRIQDLTKSFKSPILISKAVYNEVKDSIIVEDKGNVSIKGRSNVSLCSVIGLKAEMNIG